MSYVDSLRCAERHAPDTVAVLDFSGDIGATFGSDSIYELLNAITSDAEIGAVILRVDSAGGDSYVSKKLHEAVHKIGTQCQLPMASFVGNTGTSGAYWLANAADEIHADSLSTVGAVGVIATYRNEKEKLDKEGIRYTVIRTGERKWPLIPYLPVEAADIDKVRASLDIVLGEFADAVVASRQGKLKLSRERLLTGEAWMGQEAYQLGLTDGPSSVEAVAARLLGRTPLLYRRFDLAAALVKPVRPDNEFRRPPVHVASD